MQKIKIARGRR